MPTYRGGRSHVMGGPVIIGAATSAPASQVPTFVIGQRVRLTSNWNGGGLGIIVGENNKHFLIWLDDADNGTGSWAFQADTSDPSNAFSLAVVDPCMRDRVNTTETRAWWVNPQFLQVESDEPEIQPEPPPMWCAGCGDSYPFAEPNLPDGRLICFSCRQSGRRPKKIAP